MRVGREGVGGITDAKGFFFSPIFTSTPPLTALSTPGSRLWEEWFRPGSPQHSAGEEKMLVVD